MQVNFLTKLVALRPGKPVQEMIKNVMQGKDEGAEDSSDEEDAADHAHGIAGKVSAITLKTLKESHFTKSSPLYRTSHAIESLDIFYGALIL